MAGECHCLHFPTTHIDSTDRSRVWAPSSVSDITWSSPTKVAPVWHTLCTHGCYFHFWIPWTMPPWLQQPCLTPRPSAYPDFSRPYLLGTSGMPHSKHTLELPQTSFLGSTIPIVWTGLSFTQTSMDYAPVTDAHSMAHTLGQCSPEHHGPHHLASRKLAKTTRHPQSAHR